MPCCAEPPASTAISIVCSRVSRGAAHESETSLERSRRTDAALPQRLALFLAAASSTQCASPARLRGGVSTGIIVVTGTTGVAGRPLGGPYSVDHDHRAGGMGLVWACRYHRQ